MTYNGWNNYETWLTNLWFENFDFSDLLEEGVFDNFTDGDITDYVTDHIAETVDSYIEVQLGRDPNGFLQDALNSFTQEVDYREIASHYVADIVADVAIRNREKELVS